MVMCVMVASVVAAGGCSGQADSDASPQRDAGRHDAGLVDANTRTTDAQIQEMADQVPLIQGGAIGTSALPVVTGRPPLVYLAEEGNWRLVDDRGAAVASGSLERPGIIRIEVGRGITVGNQPITGAPIASETRYSLYWTPALAPPPDRPPGASPGGPESPPPPGRR